MSREHRHLQRFVAAIGTLGWLVALATGAAAQPKPDRPPAPAPPSPGTQPPLKAQPQPQPQEQQQPPSPDTAPEPAPGTEPAAPSEPAPSEPPTTRRKAKPSAPPEEEEPEPPLIPAAQDSLAGHFTLSPGVALVLPFGSLGSALPQSDQLGSGPGFSVEAAIGVSRTVAIGAWGQLASFGNGDECPDCSASSLAGGIFVRYHLVQGVRFDPWMSAGLGYRATSIDSTVQGKQDYSGIEWLRLAVGGDWYAFSVLGFGPFLELDMGVYSTHPDSAGDSAAHFQLVLGARITLDVPGK